MSVRAGCRSPLGAWHTRRRRRLRPGDTDHLTRTARYNTVPRRSIPGRGRARKCVPEQRYPRTAGSTPSVQTGQASIAHGPKSRSVSTTAAAPASGSTHRNVPDCPKWPNVRGELLRARPVRGLAVADLEAEPPVVGLLPAEAGQHAVQAGERDAGGVGEGGRERGGAQLGGEARRGRRRWTRRQRRVSRRDAWRSCPAARRRPRAGTRRTACPRPRRRSRRARRSRRWSRSAGSRAWPGPCPRRTRAPTRARRGGARWSRAARPGCPTRPRPPPPR